MTKLQLSPLFWIFDDEVDVDDYIDTFDSHNN